MICMKVRYKYRLRPGEQAEQYLVAEWDACRYVWNRMVDESQARYERGETFGAAQAQKHLTFLRASRTDGNGNKWLAEHSCVPQQQIVRDYSQARGKAVSDRKSPTRKRKAGMPRHKSRKTTLPSLNYRIGGFTLVEQDGKTRLKLPKEVLIPVVWSRELPSQPRSVRVYESPDGHWYASFVVETYVKALPETGRAVGIDWGVETTASTVGMNLSTGEISENSPDDFPHMGFERIRHRQMAGLQRRMARRHKEGVKYPNQSRGYKKARTQYRKLCQRIAAQRLTIAHTWAKRVCERNDIIASEDFKPKFLSKTTMARNAQDAAIAMDIQILHWQAVKNGRRFIPVNPAYTTQTCSECGEIANPPIGLKERVYRCRHCGMVKDRDKNAAVNMLTRAGLVPEAHETIRRHPDAVPEAHVSLRLGIPRL
jgi:putative transposase